MNAMKQRVDDATDKAIRSPAMARILMDVTEPAVRQKILDAFIEGALGGVDAAGAEWLASIAGGQNDG